MAAEDDNDDDYDEQWRNADDGAIRSPAEPLSNNMLDWGPGGRTVESASASYSEVERTRGLVQSSRADPAMERRRRNRVTMVLHEGEGLVEEGGIYRPGVT